MTHARTVAVLAAVLTLALSPTVLGDEIVIDLAYDPETVDREMSKGDHDVIVRNAIPGKEYRVGAERVAETIPAPSLPGAAPGGSRPGGNRSCSKEALNAIETVATATLESEVPLLSKRILAAAPSSCRNEVEEALEGTTTISLGSAVKVRRKSLTRVVVTRIDTGRAWTVNVRTGLTPRWAVLPLAGVIWSDQEEYFTETVPVTDDEGNTSDMYRLIREEDDEILPLAGLAVTLLRETRWPGILPDAWGPFVGINFGDDGPSVGVNLGLGLSWSDHIALILGGALVDERHLLTRYADDLRDGTLLETNLTNDQLTTAEPEFRWMAGVAISFGGSNDNTGDE